MCDFTKYEGDADTNQTAYGCVFIKHRNHFCDMTTKFVVALYFFLLLLLLHSRSLLDSLLQNKEMFFERLGLYPYKIGTLEKHLKLSEARKNAINRRGDYAEERVRFFSKFL